MAASSVSARLTSSSIVTVCRPGSALLPSFSGSCTVRLSPALNEAILNELGPLRCSEAGADAVLLKANLVDTLVERLGALCAPTG